MKIILIIIALFTVCTYSQKLKEIETVTERTLDFGIEIQNDWKRIDNLLKETKDWKKFTQEDLDLISKYDAEVVENMWDVLGGGCSFYCGAGEYKVNTSSELQSQGETNYVTNNIRDFNYETAWIEGVKGYGIGEFIQFDLAPFHPRITKIIIVNGYVKNKTAWKNNSRVKKLKMYLNGEPYGIINLKNTYSSQSIKVEPIGHSEREDVKKLREMDNVKIKFEIVDVYKGDKYDDTAITEIYFDGIDVH